MSQVRLAISPARRPALAASKTITRLRRGCRVQLAKTRRSLTSPRESIFACLPAIRELLKLIIDLYSKIASKLTTTVMKIISIQNTDKEMAISLSVWKRSAILLCHGCCG